MVKVSHSSGKEADEGWYETEGDAVSAFIWALAARDHVVDTWNIGIVPRFASSY